MAARSKQSCSSSLDVVKTFVLSFHESVLSCSHIPEDPASDWSTLSVE